MTSTCPLEYDLMTNLWNLQVGVSLLRVLLFVVRPKTFVLGNIPDSKIYRSVDQYPSVSNVPGILILDIAAPIYFANAEYLRERYALDKRFNFKGKNLKHEINQLKNYNCRIIRWIEEEEEKLKAAGEISLQYLILNMSGML